MGTGMIRNLLKAGFEVVVYNRTKDHAADALKAGAAWRDTPAEVTKTTDAVR